MKNYRERLYENQIMDCLKECASDINEIIYWKKVEKIFYKANVSGLKEFSHSFKHIGNMDNEYKIEGIARIYGYLIKDEYLTPNESIYYFIML